jgi:hypothetical protein
MDVRLLEAIRAGRVVALQRAWDAGARPEELILRHRRFASDRPLPERMGAAGTYTGGFRFFPLPGYLAEPASPWPASCAPATPALTPPSDHFEVL